MQRDTILCYEISAEILMEIMDRYPVFRSFMLTRSLVRRSYFNKVKADNLQVILFRNKQEQRSQVVEALNLENEFLIGEQNEDAEKNQNEDQEKDDDMSAAGDTKSLIDKPNVGVEMSRKERSDKGLTDSIKQFKRNMRRIIKDRRYDPFHLRNRIELQDYQHQPESMKNDTLNEAIFVKRASSVITQSYAEFNVRIVLVNLMVQETLYNWQVFLRDKQEWMGNIKHVEDYKDIKQQGLMVPYDYTKVYKAEHDKLERGVLTVQQHRSQALTDNRSRELARSQYIDDKRLAVFKMIEQINLKTYNSSDFLKILARQIDKIVDVEDEFELKKAEADAAEKENGEEPQKPAMSVDIWVLTQFKTEEEEEANAGSIANAEKEIDDIIGNSNNRSQDII